MRAAESDVVQLQSRHSDQENDGELGPVSYAEHDRNEVAPTVDPQNQERDGKQEGELRERHKIEGAKRPGRERGKRRLKRHEERGRDRIGRS